jgi:hypothetical protein
MVVIAPYVLPITAATYELTGRFSPNGQFKNHAQVLAAQIPVTTNDLRFSNIGLRAISPQSRDASDSEEIVGTSKEWDEYRTTFTAILSEALREKIVSNRDAVNSIFDRFQATGMLYADRSGRLWLEVPCDENRCYVGISASDILAPASDPHLAFVLLLARVNRELKSPQHSRETLVELKQDWTLLERARTRLFPSDIAAVRSPQQVSTTAIGAN